MVRTEARLNRGRGFISRPLAFSNENLLILLVPCQLIELEVVRPAPACFASIGDLDVALPYASFVY